MIPSLNLPCEVLQEIFCIFTSPSVGKHHDIATLLSCALVSRRWARNALPYLWTNPFDQQLSYTAQLSLINAILACLSAQQMGALELSGIKLGIRFSDRWMGAGGPLRWTQPAPSRPLFPYAAFLGRLNFYKFVAAVSAREDVLEYDHYRRMIKTKLVLRALCQMFYEQGAHVHTLVISTRIGGEHAVQDHHDVLDSGEAKMLLKSISRLKIEATTYIHGDLFTGLVAIAKNVRHLDIEWSDRLAHHSPTKSINGLQALISAPEHLTHFGLYDTKRANLILPAISSQKRSLSRVVFDNVDFEASEPLTGLARCTELTAIDFRQCRNLTRHIVKPMLEAKFCHLRRVFVENSGSDASELVRFHTG